MVLFVFMLVSCEEAINTKSKPKSDSDAVSIVDEDSANDDSTQNDGSTQNDSEVTTDDDSILSDEDIPEGCGNGTIDGFEVCDGGTIDCVDINSSIYSGGKAKCENNCGGWDTATCETIGQDECTAGTKQCYGAYQYQVCDDFDDDGFTEWGEPATCSNSGTCSGNGICSNDCYSHNYYQCYNGNVYWYDSCGSLEEMKQSCGSSGYVGSKYCSNSYVYQDYKTVSCNNGYDSCSESTESVYLETCSNGCTSGSCNSAPYCGDTITNGSEVCDGNTTTCSYVLGSSYTGTAYCNGYCDGWDTSYCTSSTIAPPSTVSASDGTYAGYVYVSWSTVTNATDYYVYRSDSSTGTYSYIGDSGGSTYYYDYAPYASTYYYYKIVSYSSTLGTSAYSNYDAGWFQ